MFSRNITQVQKEQYIRHPAFASLSVIPYVKGRMVFAEMAARAVETGKFSSVIVDLPYFMNEGDLTGIAVDLFPSVSSLVIKRDDSSLIAFPFAPSNAPSAAIAAARIMEATGKAVNVICIDDSNLINYPGDCVHYPGAWLLDDYLVFTHGIECYFRSAFDQLDTAWQQLSEVQRFFFSYRASVMAERLRRYCLDGKETLFICGYQMWLLISRLIDKQVSLADKQVISDWKDLQSALVMGDPLIYWAFGMLDDFPAVVSEFYKNLEIGTLACFDKLGEIDKTIAGSLRAPVLRGIVSPSLRKKKSFHAYLTNRLALSRRLTPTLVAHLYDATHACLGKRFAREMARQFLYYPHTNMEEVIEYFRIYREGVFAGVCAFELPDVSYLGSHLAGTVHCLMEDICDELTTAERRMDFISEIFPRITAAQNRELETPHGTQWAIEKDYRFHERVCASVRKEVMQMHDAVIVRRSFGSQGDGIHIKKTILSKSTGENGVYVTFNRGPREASAKMDVFTPVVFLLSDDVEGHCQEAISDYNITKRKLALGDQNFCFDDAPPPDSVFSVAYTCSATETLCEGHIFRRRITSIAFLYTHHLMGVERYSNITKRAEKYQCRIEPWFDRELAQFTPLEMGIAWGVKYSERTVLVVVWRGWKPSKGLQSYAKSRKVQIISLPLSAFSHDYVERLRSLYFTSTALKNHPDREKILRRFIE